MSNNYNFNSQSGINFPSIQNNRNSSSLDRALIDNYLLFIHNVQVQQSNMTNITNIIHNALYNIITTTQQHEINTQNRIFERNSRTSHSNHPNSSWSNLRNNNLNNRVRRYNLNHPQELPSTTRPVSIPIHLNSEGLFNFGEPVRVFPSTEQIAEATEIMSYGSITDPINCSCPIRNEDFSNNDIVIRINQCGHIFYLNEFYGWFRDHTACPVCRHDIRDNSVTEPSANSSRMPENEETRPATTTSTPSTPSRHYDISYNFSTHTTSINADSIDDVLTRYRNFMDNNPSPNPSHNPSPSSTQNQTAGRNTEQTMSEIQLQALTTLTQTMAEDLIYHLQDGSHNDISNSDIELSLAFSSMPPGLSRH